MLVLSLFATICYNNYNGINKKKHNMHNTNIALILLNKFKTIITKNINLLLGEYI